MEEVRAVNRTEANFPQEKIDFINDAHTKEVDYWKRIALEGRRKDEKKQLRDLAPLEVFWLVKDAGKSRVESIHEMRFYLRNNYLSHTEEQARIDDIPQDDRFSFEEMSDY